MSIRSLLRRARREAEQDGVVSVDTQAQLVELGYSLSSLSRDVHPSRSN